MAIHADIFDPRHYQKVSLPIEECESLPPWCFTSPAFYESEVERVFMRAWNFVGREDELPAPGDYLTLEIAGEPIIVMRDDEGKLGAFSNSCRHRGALIIEGRGNSSKFVCPYHSWTYDTSGALRGAPCMDKTAGFDPSENGLVRLRLESWAGFMFVCFDREAENLIDYLGDLPDQFRSYDFSEMRVTRRLEYKIRCNWKIYTENSTECYHTPIVHGGSLGRQADFPVETRGNWTAIHVPQDFSIAVLPDEQPDLPHIPNLEGRCKSGTHFALVFPCVTLCCTQDCMWWLAVYADGPTDSILRVGMCFPKSTTELPNFDEVVQKYYHRWEIGIGEDNGITEVQQRGLNARRRPPGRMSYAESAVHALAKWVKQQVIDRE